MHPERQFRLLLPALQVVLASLFGGIGVWQRYFILNQQFFEGTFWDSTARFHVWPWPYKFAAITNMPALLAGSVASVPLELAWSTMPEFVGSVISLLFVPFLWYWISSRLDRRWRVGDRGPWALLGVFLLLSSGGALLPLGPTGFLPFGFFLWVITVLATVRYTRTC